MEYVSKVLEVTISGYDEQQSINWQDTISLPKTNDEVRSFMLRRQTEHINKIEYSSDLFNVKRYVRGLSDLALQELNELTSQLRDAINSFSLLLEFKLYSRIAKSFKELCEQITKSRIIFVGNWDNAVEYEINNNADLYKTTKFLDMKQVIQEYKIYGAFAKTKFGYILEKEIHLSGHTLKSFNKITKEQFDSLVDEGKIRRVNTYILKKQYKDYLNRRKIKRFIKKSGKYVEPVKGMVLFVNKISSVE